MIRALYNKGQAGFNILKILMSLWWQENNPRRLKRKPITINLNANDICNSKCTMCNIWKQKKDYEVNYDDLKIIFSDSFYSEIQHVGITGGEPTLRKDLVSIYQACIDFLPSLKSLSIITNCIVEEDVKNQLSAINDLCKSHNKDFHVMISLDGYEETHDLVRGRQGNFLTAVNILNFVKNDLNIEPEFGATISKINVWDIDELLSFAKENNWYGRFRVAEFIQRLYNNDRGEVIRNFTRDEAYHLVLFFEKLKLTFEKKSVYKRTYSSIQNMLLGGDRLIGCPYHTKGLLLNAKGELAYCAPKSKLIGNAIQKSSEEIYNKNLDEKRRIIKEDCSSCIHDYHATITLKEKISEYKSLYAAKYLKIDKVNQVRKMSILWRNPGVERNKYSILIVGWYGTETVGDKAILAGIIQEYQDRHEDNLSIYIASLFPFISQKTIEELNINATVVDASEFEFLKYSKFCDEIIMGGGPLMDLRELYVPLLAFNIAEKYGNKRIIYGCGLGPLNEAKYLNSVRDICLSANEVKLRDQNSVDFADANFGIKKAINIGDPARTFLQKKNVEKPNKQNALHLYLRDLPYEYQRARFSFEEFQDFKQNFEEGLAVFIKKRAEELGVNKIGFFHMHNFIVGGDDRDFSRRFVSKYFEKDDRVVIQKELSTVNNIIDSMMESRENICMRFHSVLFAETLGSEFWAIDYTSGGKIKAYAEENNFIPRLMELEDFINH